MSTFVTEKSVMIFRIDRYSTGFVHKPKQKRINKIVFPYGINIYKNGHVWAQAYFAIKEIGQFYGITGAFRFYFLILTEKSLLLTGLCCK